jgi:hypothetical protein
MRSDRSPYFFLKKSKDPKVQDLLAKAANMSVKEVDKLVDIKPDLKKAMLFIAQFGEQSKSATSADLIATQMQQLHKNTNGPHTFDIFQFNGGDFFAKCETGSSILITTGTPFILDGFKIFIVHNWIDSKTTDHILSQSKKISNGTFNDLNIIIQNLHNKISK